MYKNIPEELKALNNWVCFDVQQGGDGKATKLPKQPNGQMAKVNDRATWTDFNSVLRAVEQGRYNDIGFCFTDDIGLFGVDIDAEYIEDVDTETGEILNTKVKNAIPLQNAIDGTESNVFSDFLKLDTYTERSVSGSGIHLIFKGISPQKTVQGGGNKHTLPDGKGVEIYSDKRFFIFTGDVINQSPIIDGTEILKPLYSKYWGTPKNKPVAPNNSTKKGTGTAVDIDVNKLYNRLINTDDTFIKYATDTTGSGDISSKRQGLLQKCGWWTGYDKDKALELFRLTDFYKANKDRECSGYGGTYDKKWDSRDDKDWEKVLLLKQDDGYTPKSYDECKGVTFHTGYTATEPVEHSKAKNEAELYKRLKDEGDTHRQRLKEEGKANPKIPYEIISSIILKHAHCLLLERGERDLHRLAIYSDRGIYEISKRYIDGLIKQIEPSIGVKGLIEVKTNLELSLDSNGIIKKPTKDKNLVCCANGVYNRKTKKLEPFTPNYIFESKIATKYVENAPKPVFSDGWDIDKWFNEDIAEGDEKKQLLLWQCIMDCAYINDNHKRSYIIYDEKSNTGKSGFIILLMYMVGRENAYVANLSQMEERFSTGSMVGKVLIVGDDNDKNVRVAKNANFKSIVSGDPINIERKGEQAFSGIINATVVQATNGVPVLNVDDGLLNRLRVIKFPTSYRGDNINYNVKDTYVKDPKLLEYVLSKALSEPVDPSAVIITDECKEVINEIAVTGDTVRAFCDDIMPKIHGCIADKKTSVITPDFLFTMYQAWCENVENIKTSTNKRTFVAKLKEMQGDYNIEYIHSVRFSKDTYNPYDYKEVLKDFMVNESGKWDRRNLRNRLTTEAENNQTESVKTGFRFIKE